MGSRHNTEVPIPNFKGGQASAKGIGTLDANEMAVMDNVLLLSEGNGFRNKEGNTAVNSSAIGGGNAVTGLGIRRASSVDSLLAVAGGTINVDTGISGTFSDITGTVAITSNQNNLWTLFQANGLTIGVGGAPNPAWKYNGTGNASLLGGSPPTGGVFGFQYGNRTFIMDTTKIYWSVLLNSEDWTSDGSGNASIEPNDGDVLVTAAPLNLNSVLLFKKSSVYLMTGRESPFPVFPLFKGVGCAGAHGAVVFNGICYFIDPTAKMVVTDGSSILDIQNLSDADDVWDGFRSFRLPYIQGQVISGADFDVIVWSCTKTDENTNDFAVVWDLRNKCWMTFSTGYEANAFTVTSDGQVYMGGYDGKVYKEFASNTYTEASNGSAAISWSVESDWITLDSLLSIKQVNRYNALYMNRDSGTATFSYGYDFTDSLTTDVFSIVNPSAAIWDSSKWDQSFWDGYRGRIQNNFVLGRGNVFKWKLSGSNAVSYRFSRVSLFGKEKGQKMFTALY